MKTFLFSETFSQNLVSFWYGWGLKKSGLEVTGDRFFMHDVHCFSSLNDDVSLEICFLNPFPLIFQQI